MKSKSSSDGGDVVGAAAAAGNSLLCHCYGFEGGCFLFDRFNENYYYIFYHIILGLIFLLKEKRI